MVLQSEYTRDVLDEAECCGMTLVLGSLGIGEGRYAYTGVAANAVAGTSRGRKNQAAGDFQRAELKRLQPNCESLARG